MPTTVVKMAGIQKRFPGVHALDNAQIELLQGQVHGLIGENGAGKSTLMKVLAGVYEKDGGTVTVKGREVSYKSPIDALGDGVCMVHQELNLIPHLSVADNIYIGREPSNGLFLNKKKTISDAREVLKSLNLDIDPEIELRRLSVAKQQMVEIAKALTYNADILIMDEPTAALTESEIEDLFRFIHMLKEKNVAIVYISHRLEELKIITDVVTVMRDGQYVGTVKTSETELSEIISMMVGRTIYEEPKSHSMVPQDAPIAMSVSKIESQQIHGVSFDLYRGEILGLSGLMGAGRTETARLIFGADPKTGGSMKINGKEVKINSPMDAVACGIGYLSEDRKAFGLATGLSVADNVVMSSLENFMSGIVVNERKISDTANDMVGKIGIKTPTLKQLVRNLSGGNQQKVVVAKWLVRNCDILIFDEPTRGIDVGAKSEIYKLMNQLVAQGKSIIMISSEMPELLRMSDRIVVMNEGYKTGEVKIEDATQEKIMQLATTRMN